MPEITTKNKRKRIIKLGFWGFLGLFLLFLIFYLPPRLPILTGYVAKEACSCTFVADRDIQRTFKEDVGYFPLNFASTTVNEAEQFVTSSFLGLARQKAVFREGLGCALVHDLPIEKVQSQAFVRPTLMPDTVMPFPYGDLVSDTLPNVIDETMLTNALDFAFQAKGTRAIVVVYNGQIIGERYAKGFDRTSKHLGWSMSKSITNALYGILINKGFLNLDTPAPVEAWQQDERREITINNLLQMCSGLRWKENYFDVSNATTMLFKRDDLGKYAATALPETRPNEKWKYASGTTNLLAEIMEDIMSNQRSYWIFPYGELFTKINARSFLLEADASGTFVGSSYSWANARDWARLGLLYLNDGVWNDQRILPEGWVAYSTTPVEQSDGLYGAQIWLNQSQKYLKDAPKDLYGFDGFNGQYVSVIPSKNLVIVRLGLDSEGLLDYNQFVRQVVASVKK